MIDYNDFGKAREMINGLFKLSDEIQKASQYLNDALANLDWYEKVYNEIPGQKDAIISAVETPVTNILSYDYSKFSVSDASGTTVLTPYKLDRLIKRV